jgi:hypothetical protein
LVAIAAPPRQSSKPRDSCGTIVAFARQPTTVRPGSGPDKLAAAVPDYGRRVGLRYRWKGHSEQDVRFPRSVAPFIANDPEPKNLRL